MVLYGPTALIVQNWANERHKIFVEDRKWIKVPGNHTDIYASFKTWYFVMLAPLQTLFNAVLIAKGLELGTKLKRD
jgi:hypothetical protein